MQGTLNIQLLTIFLLLMRNWSPNKICPAQNISCTCENLFNCLLLRGSVFSPFQFTILLLFIYSILYNSMNNIHLISQMVLSLLRYLSQCFRVHPWHYIQPCPLFVQQQQQLQITDWKIQFENEYDQTIKLQSNFHVCLAMTF